MPEISPEDLITYYRQRAADLEFELVKHQIALEHSEREKAHLMEAVEELQQPTLLKDAADG